MSLKIRVSGKYNQRHMIEIELNKADQYDSLGKYFL